MKKPLAEVTKLAPPGPPWLDEDGFIAAGRGDDYVTVADFDTNDRDIAEREANKALFLHWKEHGPKLLLALRQCATAMKMARKHRGLGFGVYESNADAAIAAAEEVEV